MSTIAKVKDVAFGAMDSVADAHITAALTEAKEHYGTAELGSIYNQVVALHAAHLLSLAGGPGGAAALTVKSVSVGKGSASKTYSNGSGGRNDLSTTSYGQRLQALLATVVTTPIALYE